MTFHSRDISDKLLYTATEACQIIFGDSKKSTMNRMYRMLNDGAIDAERVGGTWFISAFAAQGYPIAVHDPTTT